MMAASAVMSFCDDHRGSGRHEQNTLRPKIGLVDGQQGTGYMFTRLSWRCSSVYGQRDRQPQPVERSVSNESIKAVELFELAENTLSSDIEPPPPYDASFKDIPPPYTSHHLFPKEHLPLQPSSDIFIVFEKAPNFCLCPMTAPGIDFGEVPNLRQAAGKKKNKKSGNQSKAADSGDEGNKNPGEGETNGGADGGEGGGSNNGDGGAGGEGGGDGGGDEWNDWNMTKKKKGKKGKNNVEEEEKKKEEEEKKKMEEEKKKEEEEELAKAGDPLSWANGGDADPDDEWGNFIEKKGKKGKKAKVTPLPEPTPSSNPGFLSNFDSIDLNDTPQLDLNFNDGLAAKGPGTGFEFGGWGTNWNTPSKWDVDGLGKGTGDITDKSKDVKDNKDMAVEDSNAWSMGGGKKSKKKSGTSAFGFDGFSKLEEEEEQSKKDGIDAEANEDWASSFPSVGKKDKKSKKKGLVEVVPKDPDSLDISVVEAEPVANEDDAWSSWGGAANKREKKKGKKGDLEASISELPQAPPLSSDAQADSTLVEEWGVFGSKKDKKKLKKGAPTEAFKNDEPSVNIGTDQMPEPEMASAWEFGTKKEKKKNQKGATKEQVKPAEPLNDLISDTKPFGDFDVDFSGKKENKKGTNVILEESFPTEEVDLDVPPTSETDKGWNFGTKNDKKKSKKAIPEEPALNAVSDMIEPDPLANAGWNSFPTKKEKNKNKKSAMDDTKPVEGFADVPEQDPIVEDTFPSWGAVAKTEKKGKKTKIPEVKDDPIAILDTTAAVDASNNVADNNWMDWGGEKKKDKKNKKGTFAEDKNDESFSPLQPDIPDVLEFPETFPSDSWGAAPNKKDKKGKKSKAMENEPAIIEVPDFSDKFEVNPGEDDFGGWGLSAKDKKKMEREKERDEQKQKEKEREEQEQKENEEEEAKEREEIKEKEKEKAKAGKKGKVSGSSANSKTKDLIANSTPDIPPIPSIEEDNSWGMWGNTKANKKKGGNKDKPFEAPPPAPTPPAQGLTPEPTPEPVPDFDNAGMVGWGSFTPTNAKGKKDTKKPVKAGKDKTEFPNAESFIEKGPELDDVNESNWGSFGPVKAKNKKDVKKPLKAGKDKFEDPIVESTLDQVPELDDIDGDDWGSIGLTKGSGKKDTKKSTKVEDSKGAKKTVKEKVDDVLAGFLEADIKDDAEESPVKEETPAKAAKSFWSMGGTTSKSKAAKEKEKEKEKAEAEAEAEEARRVDEATQKAEQEANDLIDFDMGEGAGLTLGFEDTPMKKGKSKVADARLSKVSTKESDKASKASKTSDKGRANEKDKGKGNGNGKKTEESNAAAEAEVLALLETTSAAGAEADGGNSKKADAWSFWGSKKTSGPKLDEPKKEIAKHEPANHIDSLNFLSNEPEPSFMDDEPIAPIIPKSAKTTMSTSKPAGKASSTVAARVKALEKEREKAKALEPIPSPLDEEFEPLAKNDPPKKLSAGAKPKAAAAAAGKGATGKKKGSSPAIEEESQASKDSVPGSFPAEGADDDIYDVIVPSPVTKKTNKKSSKAMKEPFMDQLDIMDLEVEDTMLPPAVPEAPPTPPPEAPAAKPVKKERAKVVRDAGSSWGFWGPTPKKPVKEAKPKDDVGASTPAPKEKLPANGLARAKSTKVPKEKEVEKSSAKSSSSDKDKKTDSRPSKQRISSFGGFFGAPPPTRTKPVRRGSQAASRNISRRQSMDIDVGGLPSPPAEDAPEMSTKAAKVMGATPGKLNRKESTRAKQRASVVPDPYHIDDDDMVMINAPEDPIMNEAIPEKKEAPKSTKRKVKNEELKSSDLADGMVMVDAGPSQDRIEKSNGQDDLGFVIEKPKPLQRASTNAKRPGKLMGLLNGFQKTRRMSETYERPRGKTIMGDEGNTGRKRTVTSGNDAAKRIRHDDRRIRRSERPDVTVAGLVIDDHKPDDDVPPGLDDSEARREERRLRRASKLTPGKDARDAEDRRTRRREVDLAEQNTYRTIFSEAKDKKTRKEDVLEVSRQEERRARRAAAKEEKNPRDLGFDVPEKRSSRRERKPIEKEDPNVESSRPHRSERRRSYMDKPLSPTSEPEHRPHRSRRTTAERSSHRKSTAIGDYFDPRNGAAEDPIPTSPPPPPPPPPPPDPQEPYMHGANDPTSSWVKSQISEPPPPPPPEPSVLDPAPRLGGPPDEDAEEEARRARRRERRQSKYRNDDGEDVDRRRRRKEREIRSSEGSGDGALKDRRRSDYGGVPLKGMDSKGFGAGAGKRGSSWFKKIGL